MIELSKETILGMEAGREIDALVAERIMGWGWYPAEGRKMFRTHDRFQYGGVWYDDEDKPEFQNGLPFYSTDIKATLDVVEKIIAAYPYEGRYTGRDPIIITRNDDNTEWYVEVACWGWEYAEHESLPLAICRAALMAKMDDR